MDDSRHADHAKLRLAKWRSDPSEIATMRQDKDIACMDVNCEWHPLRIETRASCGVTSGRKGNRQSLFLFPELPATVSQTPASEVGNLHLGASAAELAKAFCRTSGWRFGD